jgi:hypothetical protein
MFKEVPDIAFDVKGAALGVGLSWGLPCYLFIYLKNHKKYEMQRNKWNKYKITCDDA